ncbi:MAG: hypothetical protein M3457_06455 [Chloroflexota bacterium]|nr:hypothetical protein [Chloroflexota bacterium]
MIFQQLRQRSLKRFLGRAGLRHVSPPQLGRDPFKLDCIPLGLLLFVVGGVRGTALGNPLRMIGLVDRIAVGGFLPDLGEALVGARVAGGASPMSFRLACQESACDMLVSRFTFPNEVPWASRDASGPESMTPLSWMRGRSPCRSDAAIWVSTGL